MTIVVTGGAGFIGSNFIFRTLNIYPCDRVVCLDKLTYAGNLCTLSSVLKNPSFRFVQLDICDREGVFALFEEEKPDIVVNFAAESHVDRSIQSPAVFLQTNVIGTATLLDACLKFGVKRFHQVSTDEVYGDLPLERSDMSFSEKSLVCPNSPYSASKASADLLCLAYRKTYGLPVTISRSSNNYGFYQYPEKLVPLVIEHALNGRDIPVYGSGENVRDWLFVEDHCEAIDLIIRKGRDGEIYNVGGNCTIPNLDIVIFILEALGKSENLITFVADRKGHDRRYAIDFTKIRTEFGWFPRTEFAEGMKKTIAWYLRNGDWREAVLAGKI